MENKKRDLKLKRQQILAENYSVILHEFIILRFYKFKWTKMVVDDQLKNQFGPDLGAAGRS